MTFNWVEYLNLADTIVRERARFSNDEACYRAAISRAYYATFCTARNRARDREGLAVTNTGADHNLVKNHFQRAPDKSRQKIGLWLDRLRGNRNDADYLDRNLSNAASLCASSLAQARNALNELTTL